VRPKGGKEGGKRCKDRGDGKKLGGKSRTGEEGTCDCSFRCKRGLLMKPIPSTLPVPEVVLGELCNREAARG